MVQQRTIGTGWGLVVVLLRMLVCGGVGSGPAAPVIGTVTAWLTLVTMAYPDQIDVTTEDIAFPGKSWTQADPAEFGISAKALDGIDELMRKAEANGALIRNGRMVAEWNYSALPNSRINVKSITKCITGILYGLALDDGLIPGPDTRIKDAWPDFNAGPYAGDITFEHLASATSGLKATAPYWQHFTSLGRGVDFKPPGPPAEYSNDHTVYLAGALTYLFKQDLLEVLRERVLDKIGADAEWMTNGERSPNETGVRGTFRSSESDNQVIPPAHVALSDGNRARWVSGFSRSCWTAGDLARVGWLFLNDGNWNGAQIIPRDYARECRRRVPGRTYLAWRTVPVPDGDDWWCMAGAGGQFCVLIPEHNTVMVKLNDWPNKTNGAHPSRPQVGLRDFVPLLSSIAERQADQRVGGDP